MFPPGFPGFALLLMRASVVLALLLAISGRGHVLPGWLHAAAFPLAVALLLGYLTPIAAWTALALHVLSWLYAGIDSEVVAAIYALDAIALALLGPGAYSIDAYRFGRRLVVLPPR